MATPTEQTYNELQRAYDYFNAHLFSDDLPPCLITLQRQPRTRGYFSPGRFINGSGSETDEIAMNPQFFVINTIEESLSTLAHEMVHLQQHHAGTSGRRGYHNKAWADKMESIGLIPSTTGQKGGKRTGEKVTHYIEPGGVFESVCNELVTEAFELSWMDRFPPDEVLIRLQQESEQDTENTETLPPQQEAPTIEPTATPVENSAGDPDPHQAITPSSGDQEPPTPAATEEQKKDEEKEQEAEKGTIEELPPVSTAAVSRKILEKAKSVGIDVAGAVERKQRKNGSNRVKYSCPECNANVWGKAGLNIICGECSGDIPVSFVAQ
jgi:predicted SprT family Zn-dependent metalloprotease